MAELAPAPLLLSPLLQRPSDVVRVPLTVWQQVPASLSKATNLLDTPAVSFRDGGLWQRAPVCSSGPPEEGPLVKGAHPPQGLVSA
jgi:hypothetical protein